METKTVGQWLEERLREEHLSLRQAAEKTGLSHATIADIRNGIHPCPETIQKLARGFGGNDTNWMLALEDYLLTLAGYRTPRPAGKEPNVALGRLIDKVSKFSEPELGLMINFADFLVEIER